MIEPFCIELNNLVQPYICKAVILLDETWTLYMIVHHVSADAYLIVLYW